MKETYLDLYLHEISVFEFDFLKFGIEIEIAYAAFKEHERNGIRCCITSNYQ